MSPVPLESIMAAAAFSSVTVDEKPLAAEAMGLATVGQVLSHVSRGEKRLVVDILIDGARPDLSGMAALRRSPVLGRTIYIETADPREVVRAAIASVEAQLLGAEGFEAEAADLLQQDKIAPAMEKLGHCLTVWQTAEDAVRKTAQLMKLDLESVDVDGQSMSSALASFAEQLSDVKRALTRHDYVSLSDLLLYEMTDGPRRWSAVLDAVRRAA